LLKISFHLKKDYCIIVFIEANGSGEERQKQKIFVVHYKIGEKRMMDQNL